METRHDFTGTEINKRFQTKLTAEEKGGGAFQRDIRASRITLNGKPISDEDKNNNLSDLLFKEFGGKDKTGKETGRAYTFLMITQHISVAATLQYAYALFDIKDAAYSSNIYRKDDKFYYRTNGYHERGNVEAIYELTPQGYNLISYSVEGEIADAFKNYVDTGALMVNPLLAKRQPTTIEKPAEPQITRSTEPLEAHEEFYSHPREPHFPLTIPKTGSGLKALIIDYLNKPNMQQNILNGLIDQFPESTHPYDLVAVFFEYLRSSSYNKDTAYKIIRKFPNDSLETLKSNVNSWLPDMEPDEFGIVNKRIGKLLNDLPNKKLPFVKLRELHDTLNFIRKEFVKIISKLSPKTPSSPGVKVSFNDASQSFTTTLDTSSQLSEPVSILREGEDEQPIAPVIQREYAEEVSSEVEEIIPVDKLTEASVNFFRAIQQARKDKNFDNPINALRVLNEYISADKDEKVIIEKIKAQLIQSLDDLKDKGVRKQLAAIRNVLAFSVNDVFDEASDEKVTFDLYQDALKEVVATLVINHFNDKAKNAKFANTKHLMQEISTHLADLFEELKVIDIEDEQKKTIYFQFLEAAMLEDYTTVLDYPSGFKSHSFNAALTHIKSNLNILQQFSLEKKIAAQEKETFYKTVTLHLLEQNCEKYLYELAEQGKGGSKSFERVDRFYRMVLRHAKTPFNAGHPEELMKNIEIFKRQASHEGTPERDADFIAQIEKIAALKPERQSNHLEALLLKLSTLEMVNVEKNQGNYILTFPWTKATDSENLKSILSYIHETYGKLTAKTFLEALDNNENKPVNERIPLSDACINTFSEYLKFMEEVEAFATQVLPGIGLSNELLIPAFNNVLVRLDEKFLNTMLIKLEACSRINQQFNIHTIGSDYILPTITGAIEDINEKRYTMLGQKVSRQELISTINAENQNQKERDAAYALSHKNYVTTKPTDWTMHEQRTQVYRHKTVNDLINICRAYKNKLKEEAFITLSFNVDLSKSLEKFKDVLRKTQDVVDFLGDRNLSPSKLLKKILEHSEEEPYATWLAQNKQTFAIPIINRLLAGLEEKNVPPYKKLLAFETELAKIKDNPLLQEVNLNMTQLSLNISGFLDDVDRTQDSNVVLHNACNVFQQEMSDKVENILTNKGNEKTLSHFQQMAKAANEKSIIPSIVRTYNATQNRDFRYAVNQNDELLTTLKKYRAVEDMKKELTAYELRPQIALRDFKKKLIKHEAVLKKDEDGPVTKFFLAIARAFGYVPKKTSVERFYKTTKNTLFVKQPRLPASKPESFEDKFRKNNK